MSDASTQPKDNDDGVWIGIDWGTSHCAAAVWDSRRMAPKWMRLPHIATREGSKVGRLVPSVVLFVTKDAVEQYGWQEYAYTLPWKNDQSIQVLVGQAALDVVHESYEDDTTMTSSTKTTPRLDPSVVAQALVTLYSLKLFCNRLAHNSILLDQN